MFSGDKEMQNCKEMFYIVNLFTTAKWWKWKSFTTAEFQFTKFRCDVRKTLYAYMNWKKTHILLIQILAIPCHYHVLIFAICEGLCGCFFHTMK